MLRRKRFAIAEIPLVYHRAEDVLDKLVIISPPTGQISALNFLAFQLQFNSRRYRWLGMLTHFV
ncbi:hypothetical protein DFI02_11628 [Rhizobium sp. PP-F2F-G20b]|nr:hypothetical protein DFI02_11628 [Rhizobium sp. PP-F2F-G20b]